VSRCRPCGGPEDIVKIYDVITYSHSIGDVCPGCGRVWDRCRQIEVDGTHQEQWRPARADEALATVTGGGI
jgi:hypothetical protein